jgi:hypothetical protein
MAVMCKSLPFIVVILLCPATSYAYLDPGAGSILIQSLIAIVAIMGATLKVYWHKIFDIFSKRKSRGNRIPGVKDDENKVQ